MRKQTLFKVSPVSGSEEEDQRTYWQGDGQRGEAVRRKAGGADCFFLIKTNNNSNRIWPAVTRCGLLLSCGCYFTCLCLGSSSCVCELLIHSGSLNHLDQIG